MTDLSIDVAGREVRLTNPDRVLWPEVGWTKAHLVAYVRSIAPFILPHLRDRAVTLARFPAGVGASGWFQTNCPPGAPAWVRTVSFVSPAGKPLRMCVIDDEATLVWAANGGAIELHPFLATIERPDEPLAMVLDLDPGEPAGLVDGARVALELRARLEARGLAGLPKTSGLEGLHVYVPIRGARYVETKALARALAEELAADEPARVTARMPKRERAGRVFIDWGQNDPMKSTVAPYSLRATSIPLVSTPLEWTEIEAAADTGSARSLRFTPPMVVDRTARLGDLFRAALGVPRS